MSVIVREGCGVECGGAREGRRAVGALRTEVGRESAQGDGVTGDLNASGRLAHDDDSEEDEGGIACGIDHLRGWKGVGCSPH